MRLLSCVCSCALFAAFTPSTCADEPKQTWVTIKGRVVFPEGKPLPKREPLDVKQDRPHCLANGPLLDEAVIVNPKNRGIKNVVVYLRPAAKNVLDFPAAQIHPDDAKRKPAEVVIDQPCCLFVNRVTIARPGDKLVVKNPAPVAHNFFWTSQHNGDLNETIPAGKSWTLPKPLVLERSPIPYRCTIHPWMAGYVRIFDHPYFALTDTDGNFTIPNAPAGQFRIVFWHESVGVRGGIEGRFGEPIAVAGPTMEMKPTDFEVGSK
jgi:hypothetical protein